MVYNLEYQKFLSILNQFSASARLQQEDYLLTHPLADYNIYANLTNDTNTWTMTTAHIHKPNFSTDPKQLHHQKLVDQRIFYVEFPNVQDAAFNTMVYRYFQPVAIKKINVQGYVLEIVQLKNSKHAGITEYPELHPEQ